MASVAGIAFAPVKGLALVSRDEVVLEAFGVRENRRFHLIDEDGRLVNGKTAGPMVQVVAEADPDGRRLRLSFPYGDVVEDDVDLGEPVETGFFGRPVTGRLVNGAFAAALSTFAGRRLRLVRLDEPGAGTDRGEDGTISLVSLAGLDALAREAGVDEIDTRRFRMLFTIAGVGANEEDAWLGRRVALGDAVVVVRGLVGRCVVTSHNPATGLGDLDTLRTIRRYRPEVEGQERLPMGVFGSVERPGTVRVGSPVAPL